MNNKFLLLSLILLFSVIQTVFAGKTVIAVSPDLEVSVKEKIKAQTLAYILTKAEPRSTIVIMNTSNGHVMTRITIPSLSYDNAKSRARHLGKDIAKFIQELNAPSQSALKDAVDLPKLLSSIERHRPDTLLIIGNPLYLNARSPAHNWVREYSDQTQHYYPSDSFFFAGQSSPWSVNPERLHLSETTVHWLLAGEYSFPNQVYEEAIKRYYALYIELEGGKLVSFLDDTDEAFNGLSRQDLKAFQYTINQSENRLIMHQSNLIKTVKDKEQASTVKMPQIYDRIILLDCSIATLTHLSDFTKTLSTLSGRSLIIAGTVKNRKLEYTRISFDKNSSAVKEKIQARESDITFPQNAVLQHGLTEVIKQLNAAPSSPPQEVILWLHEKPSKLDQHRFKTSLNQIIQKGCRVKVWLCHECRDLVWLPKNVEMNFIHPRTNA